MELSPRFLFCNNIEKITKIQHKKEQKSALCKERANVTTSSKCRDINQGLNAGDLNIQCRDIGSVMSRHRISDVTTSYQGSLGDEISIMSQHQANVTTSATTLVESFKTTRLNVATSRQKCESKGINKLCRDIDSVSQHQLDVATSEQRTTTMSQHQT